MKHTKKSILSCAVGLLSLTACANGDCLPDADSQPLCFVASQQGTLNVSDGNTRAADGLYTASTGFDGTETVRLFLGEEFADYNVGAADAGNSYRSALTPASTRLYYPAGTEGQVTVYAVYPAASAVTHTLGYDQTIAEGYKASDLMYARRVVSLSQKTTQQVLTFGHQLVKLKLRITKASDVANIAKVELKNVKRKATVTVDATSMTLSDLTTATGSDAARGDNILVSGPITDNETHTCVVVFPAQAWADADFIEFTTSNNETAVWKLTKTSWTSGAEYTMTFTINASTLGLISTITDWTEGNTVDDTSVPLTF